MKGRAKRGALPPTRHAGPLGVICGGGWIPLSLAETVRKRGRAVVLYPIHGFADPAAERFPHRWIHLGGFGRLLDLLRADDCKEVVLVGSVVRPRLTQLRFDLLTLRLLPRLVSLFRGGDNQILSGLVASLEERGIRVLGAQEVAPELLFPAGFAGRVRAKAVAERDISVGLRLLRTLGPFDIGQAVVIAGNRVVAMEAAEGTAGMLARVAELRRDGKLKLPAKTGVLVKAPKPKQERRIDLPAIGPDTVAQAAAAGLAGIAVEAGSTLVADASRTIRAADAAGLFLLGVSRERGR